MGHGYTAKHLLAEQDESVERALWAAMRVMEERGNMIATMAREERERGRDRSASAYDERAEESREHAQAIRKLLTERA